MRRGGAARGESFVLRPQAPGAGHPARLAAPHKRRRPVARCDACGVMLTLPLWGFPEHYAECWLAEHGGAAAARPTGRPQRR